jgi:putative transposase
MSKKYKFHNKEGLYFVSFATVYWLDVFVRDVYFNEMLKSLVYSRIEKGLELSADCIMPSHVDLIFRAKDNKP